MLFPLPPDEYQRSTYLRMCWINRYAIGVVCALSCTAVASEVSGKITIEKKVINKSFPWTAYDLRGVAVADAASDLRSSNEFEKIAVWLDFPGIAPPSPIAAT